MIYRYLSLSLAIGLTLFSASPGLSSPKTEKDASFQDSRPSDASSQQNDENKVDSITTAQLKETSYLSLMSAGYSAQEQNNYAGALGYFRQALNLRPGDLKAEKAVKTIGNQGFDLLMQAGYSADMARDYNNALSIFQQALQIRPDSQYAKKAVSNISGYLAQQPVDAVDAVDADAKKQAEASDSDSSGFNIWFTVILLGAIGAFSLGLIFYLFQKTGKTISESGTKGDRSSSGVREDLAQDDLENVPHISEVNEEDASGSLNEDSRPRETEIVASQSNLAKLDLVPELVQELASGERSIRRKAVWELAQRGDSRAMKPLVELIVEVDSQERGLILEAMTQIAGRTLKPMNKALMLSLNDENSQVKQNAIRDLTRVYELMSQVTKRLSLAVEDSDAQVQETAKWALQKLNQMPNTTAWNMVDNVAQDSNHFNGSSRNQPSNGNGSNASSKTTRQEYPFN